MRAAFAVIALAASAAPALADDTFTAKRLAHIDDVAWATTATCADGSDTEQRQCKQLRDARGKQLAASTWLVEADATAFVVGAYDAKKKSAPVTIAGCVNCAGVSVEGTQYGVYTGAPRVDGGKVTPPAVNDAAQRFATVDEYTAWKTKVAAGRVELVIKGAGKRWSGSGKHGVLVDVVGYRVVVPCTGEVVLGTQGAPPAAPDKSACAK